MDLMLKYYPDVDILVIELGEDRIADEEWLDNDVVIGYNEKGKIVRIEIHYASKRGLLNIVQELARTRRDLIEHVLRTVTAET